MLCTRFAYRSGGAQRRGQKHAELAQAAIAAIQALKTLGQQNVSVDLALRGICGDCAPTQRLAR